VTNETPPQRGLDDGSGEGLQKTDIAQRAIIHDAQVRAAMSDRAAGKRHQ
jgi:hypothetical protein